MKPALFMLHDQDRQLGARPAGEYSARDANFIGGYGIFWVVNSFTGARRTTNLTRINYWFCECDEGTKEEQLRRLQLAPLLPSVVVESKRGFHAYWAALDATPERWKEIVRWGLVPALKGDPRATDPLRLLRCPGYLHQKDPDDPFMVRKVWETALSYTEEQMLAAFPSQEPETKPRQESPSEGGTFWERVAALDGRDAIDRVSGSWLVNGEEFRLATQSNGNANIIREHDNHSTPCWIWADGRLGGIEGGNSIAAFCAWYGHKWSDIAEGLKQLFPELESDDDEELVGVQDADR
jgi:hypothetical protein